MTITDYYFTSDYERCSGLAFGVPLEDCFPADDIHPSLKVLFLNAHENIVLCGCPIDEIISKLQGSIGERLSIKEGVALCKPMSGVVSPGALLWVIRHFVGLMPVPLLSRYTDSKTFNWIGLSQFCKRALLRRPQIGGGDKLLVRKIAQELLRLPFPNLLLFSVLMHFIRALTTTKRRPPNVNKSAAICLIRYFCSSVFVRPYRPDRDEKAERPYVPFLLFAVLKWPQIERVFKEEAAGSPRDDTSEPNSLRSNFRSPPPPPPPCGSPFECQLYQSRPASTNSKIACTQTDGYKTELSTPPPCGSSFECHLYQKRPASTNSKIACSQTNDYETELSTPPPCGSSFECHLYQKRPVSTNSKIACSQTNDYETELSTRPPCGSSFECHLYQKRPASTSSKIACTQTDDYETELSTISEEFPESDFLRDVGCQTEFPRSKERKPLRYQHRCCCRYGSNYETSGRGSVFFPQDKEVQTESRDGFEEGDSLVGTVSSCSSVLPRSNSEEQDIRRRVSSVKQEVGSPPTTFVTDGEYFDDDYSNSNLNLLKSEDGARIRCDPEILARVSKIGWSYTPRTDEISTSSKTGLKEENCLLFFNGKEAEKDVRSLSSQTCVEGELLGKSASGSSTNKSKRAFGLGKIRSGLNLFKFFSRRRAKLTSSLEEVSKIKYEKMKSVRSTVF